MVRLDSVKILLPNEVINTLSDYGQINKGMFNDKINKDNVVFSKIQFRGLNKIVVDYVSNETTLEVSAKILKQNYIEGINKNTIVEVIENINETNLINFDTNKFIDSATFLRLDVTDNVKIPGDNTQLYKTLANIPLAQKYHTTFYKRKNNLGVVWKGEQTSKKDRFICYDKTKELMRELSLNTTDYKNKVINDFKDVNRFEQNLVSFKAIREYYKTNNLKDVLVSDTKANYLKFCKMTNKNNVIDLKLFQHFEGMLFKEIRNFLGDKGIIELCHYDWHRIETFVRTHNNDNYRRFIPKLKETYNILNTETNNFHSELITEIKQQLYA